MSNRIAKKKIKLNGLTPIMFDPFYGQEQRPVEKKLYFGKDGQTLILPSSNIIGFLSSQKGHSCLRLYVKSTEWTTRSNEIRGCVSVMPSEIEFKAHGEPVKFTGEWTKQLTVDKRMVQPNKKVRDIAYRPVLDIPWLLEFEIAIYQTEFVSEDRILGWFIDGGFQVGLGANRPLFGRFETEVIT